MRPSEQGLVRLTGLSSPYLMSLQLGMIWLFPLALSHLDVVASDRIPPPFSSSAMNQVQELDPLVSFISLMILNHQAWGSFTTESGTRGFIQNLPQCTLFLLKVYNDMSITKLLAG